MARRVHYSPQRDHLRGALPLRPTAVQGAPNLAPAAARAAEDDKAGADCAEVFRPAAVL